MLVPSQFPVTEWNSSVTKALILEVNLTPFHCFLFVAGLRVRFYDYFQSPFFALCLIKSRRLQMQNEMRLNVGVKN